MQHPQEEIKFFGYIALGFVALKLTGQLDWGWWRVLSPIWVPVLIWLMMIAGSIVAIVEPWKKT